MRSRLPAPSPDAGTRSRRRAGGATARPDAPPPPPALVRAGLGPVSLAMLAAAGIHTWEQLQTLGAARAYRHVRQVSPKASLNLLWALEGALSGRSWREVARTDRLSLLLQLDSLNQSPPPALP